MIGNNCYKTQIKYSLLKNHFCFLRSTKNNFIFWEPRSNAFTKITVKLCVWKSDQSIGPWFYSPWYSPCSRYISPGTGLHRSLILFLTILPVSGLHQLELDYLGLLVRNGGGEKTTVSTSTPPNLQASRDIDISALDSSTHQSQYISITHIFPYFDV